MKRGKDEDKPMGPMFPRLHVNDTEKGGPRAPPRNKMALYEQLSIPSQRFNGGVLPFNPNSNANALPPSSSTPGTMNERATFSNQRLQQEHKRRHEDDDFTVPIFDQQSGTSQRHIGNHQNRENESVTPFGAPFSGRLANVQNARQINKPQKENSHDFARSASNQPSRQNPKVPLKETNESSSFNHRHASKNVNSRDYRVDSQADNTLWGDSGVNVANKASGYENTSVPLMEVQVQQEALRSPNDLTNADAVSETSMVDSICGVDVSPDDVVGIIGQKHFWKARRAIVNQQRVFAVQVFELHRLIKVQKLIAGSPQLLFEERAFLAKPPKVTPIKKIPIEYITKHQNDENALEKPNDETEFSAENAVGKASLSSVQNGSQTTYCRPFSGNPLLVPPPADMGAWNYNPPPGHQWLIPVMSPSEGLVYKPYPGPGFMNPVYGGCGPMSGHNFGPYGAPPPDHGPTGVHPFGPPASHGYFPAYNTPPPAKETEVQVSTASSRSDKTRNRNPLPLFPTSPPAPVAATVPPPVEVAEPARVIRVVPHNARSATASVARIFQSIQEERKQYDSG